MMLEQGLYDLHTQKIFQKLGFLPMLLVVIHEIRAEQ